MIGNQQMVTASSLGLSRITECNEAAYSGPHITKNLNAPFSRISSFICSQPTLIILCNIIGHQSHFFIAKPKRCPEVDYHYIGEQTVLESINLQHLASHNT